MRGIEVARGKQRLMGTAKLMQARLIRVEGLRVAEPLVLYNYEGGAECESNKYRQDYISQID